MNWEKERIVITNTNHTPAIYGGSITIANRLLSFVNLIWPHIKWGSIMVEMISGLFCFVTVSVSFLYGTRICWISGKKCQFDVTPKERKEILLAGIPSGFAFYFFGFLVFFNCLLDGIIAIILMTLTTALLVSHFVVSMAMPALKRPTKQSEIPHC